MLRITTCLFTALILFTQSSIASAHFIWVVSEDGVARIYFGEGPIPDQEKYLDGIAAMNAYRANGNVLVTSEFVRKSQDPLGWYEIENENDAPVLLSCDYGVFSRGDSSMRIDYSAKYLRSGIAPPTDNPLRLDICPVMDGDILKVIASFDREPAEGIEIVITAEGDDSGGQTVTTADDGTAMLTVGKAQRLLIRGRKVIEADAELEGKKYSEHRFYCTVVFDVGPVAADKPMQQVNQGSGSGVPISYPDLPIAITSFGATSVNDSIYVLGGQKGDAHAYAKSWQNGKLFRMDLSAPESGWKIAAETEGAQGLALVANDNQIFRIGGFEARNEEGEDHDLHSLDKFSSFDLSTGQWKELPPLPEPRSSFDACVVDGRIYVIGGWSMRGDQPTTWSETALTFDCSGPDGEWREIPSPPFRRRALCVVANHNRIYAIGGIGEDGKTSSAVDIFDIGQNRWITGSPLPECGSLKGFGSCGFVTGNSLIVSVASGQLFRYNDTTGDWTVMEEKIEPGRFFHRVFPVSQSSAVVIGGANMEIGKFRNTEILPLRLPN